MKLIVILLFALFPITSLAVDASGNHAIWGEGKKSCISYTRSRESGDYDNFTHFIMGYLTAYNLLAENTYRISGNKNMDEILVWLDEYCELKAIHSFDQALTEFIIESYESRKKSASSFRGR